MEYKQSKSFRTTTIMKIMGKEKTIITKRRIILSLLYIVGYKKPPN